MCSSYRKIHDKLKNIHIWFKSFLLYLILIFFLKIWIKFGHYQMSCWSTNYRHFTKFIPSRDFIIPSTVTSFTILSHHRFRNKFRSVWTISVMAAKDIYSKMSGLVRLSSIKNIQSLWSRNLFELVWPICFTMIYECENVYPHWTRNTPCLVRCLT